MRWRSRRGERLWAATSARSRVLLAIGIFAAFSTLGILLDVPRGAHAPLPALALYCALCGVTAVAYAFVVVWDLRLLPVAIALLLSCSLVGNWINGRAVALSPQAQHARLVADAVVSFALVVFGYVFLIRFIHATARGHATLRTEADLARGIHEALVPTLSGRSSCAEYYGSSNPSGTIGGDLVDVVEGPDGTVLYVVDVSGHGVRAGVLMAMLKSTARTALAEGAWAQAASRSGSTRPAGTRRCRSRLLRAISSSSLLTGSARCSVRAGEISALQGFTMPRSPMALARRARSPSGSPPSRPASGGSSTTRPCFRSASCPPPRRWRTDWLNGQERGSGIDVPLASLGSSIPSL